MWVQVPPPAVFLSTAVSDGNRSTYRLTYKLIIFGAAFVGHVPCFLIDLRIGTSSPELGVPTGFSDISEYEIICETEERGAGYNPELSYGSHIFQDLVEAQILYTAVFSGEKTIHFSPEKLVSSEDMVSGFEASEAVKDIVQVDDVSSRSCEVYNDIANEHLLITC